MVVPYNKWTCAYGRTYIAAIAIASMKVALATLTVIVLSSASAAATDVPNNTITPGAQNPVVTQDNIDTTICRFGWAKSVRPPRRYTERLKRELLYMPTSPYYDRGARLRDYELDHRIPLGVGGSPTDPKKSLGRAEVWQVGSQAQRRVGGGDPRTRLPPSADAPPGPSGVPGRLA